MEVLEPKVSCIGGQGRLHDRPPIEALETKSGVSFPRWQYSGCTVTCHCCDMALHCGMTPLGVGNWMLVPGFSWLCSTRLFPLLIFTLCFHLSVTARLSSVSP